MPDEYKVCPSCLEEYTIVPTQCVECDVPLVLSHEIEPEVAPGDFPPTAELECVRVGPLPWTQALSKTLSQVDIAHRVEPDTRSEEDGGIDPRLFDGATVYGVWVRPADLENAIGAAKIVFAHIDEESEETPDADDEEQCPACQAALPLDALECPGCGLPFG